MSARNHDQLVAALDDHEREAREAIDRLRDIATDEADEDEEVPREEVYRLARHLRGSVDLLGCLLRLLPGRSIEEIHSAFGAPGDWGYETPLGDALARLYRGEAQS